MTSRGQFFGYFETVTSGHDYLPPCVMFNIARRGNFSSETKLIKSYLFGTPEEICRFTGSHSIKLSQINSLFLCSRDLSHCSGLPEIVLSLSAQGIKEINVSGPLGVKRWVGACGKTIFHGDSLKFDIKEVEKVEEVSVLKDEYIEVFARILTDYTICYRVHCSIAECKEVSIVCSENFTQPLLMSMPTIQLFNGPTPQLPNVISFWNQGRRRGLYKLIERLEMLRTLVPELCVPRHNEIDPLPNTLPAPSFLTSTIENLPATTPQNNGAAFRLYTVPAYHIEEGNVESFDAKEMQAKVLKELDEFNLSEPLQTARKSSSSTTPFTNLKEIIFLGTGSAKPSSKRGQSGILVKWRSGNVLVECGGGTLPMLYRLYGVKGCRDVLRSIQCIWVSHHHADHMEGLPKVVLAMLQAGKEKVVVIAAEAVRTFLLSAITFASKNSLKRIELIDPFDLNAPQHPLRREIPLLSGAQSVRVVHSRESYALIMRQGDEQLVFSGDCRPSNELSQVAGGNGATHTVLIHEATFDCSMIDDAKKKRHSTVTEAISIGRRMNAKHILLTHFSQRYPSITLDDSEQNCGVGICFDGLSWKPSTANILENCRNTFEEYWEKRHQNGCSRKG